MTRHSIIISCRCDWVIGTKTERLFVPRYWENDMNKVTVVILNWNGSEMLHRFLPSVIFGSAEEGVEVCVADNGSTDDSVEMLQREFPSVSLILLHENLGFAEGYNRALAQVEAEYVVLLNSDVEVSEGWLRPLIAYMDAHLEVAGCQPKIRSWHQRHFFEYAGAAGGFIDRYGYPYCRGRIMDVVEEDKANTIARFPSSGLPGQPCLSVWKITGGWADLMDVSLRTWRK